MAKGAIAVDFGASSARFAAATLEDGVIRYEIVRQEAHHAREHQGHQVWDIDRLIAFTKSAAEYGTAHFTSATVGIDSWGVDHGFIDHSGDLISPPVCYRDASHTRMFEALAGHRADLFQQTGIQHQPFNTIYQLAARRAENPSLPDEAARWLILPDLIGYLLTRQAQYEITQASTTQLMATDATWCPAAFELCGWPIPDLAPTLPGFQGGYVAPNVRLAVVGSHDTASAVFGLEPLAEDTVFLNVGTWSLLGCVLDSPNVSLEAALGNFTNERCVDGRVRFLKNVAGFWVINRLHQELPGVPERVADWLAGADLNETRRLHLDAADLFAPESMLAAAREQIEGPEPTTAEWGGIALHSLVDALAGLPAELGRITGRRFTKIRVGGGGSRSEAFRELLAQQSGLAVEVGTVEASVLGNLALQFVAQGALTLEEARGVVARS